MSSTAGEQLLQEACPSIRYRFRREILGEPPDSPALLRLQTDILEDPLVQTVFGWQHADGWLAYDFHGSQSTEAGIRILCEKAVSLTDPRFMKALEALKVHGDRLERGIGKPGRVLDARGFGGSEAIRAALLAQAGQEDWPAVSRQIEAALQAFAAVLAVPSMDDLFESHKGKRIFRQGCVWPSIYHLRLLAYTHTWRSPQAMQMLAQSLARLVDWSPIPAALVLYRSQLIAPASFAMDDFNCDLSMLSAGQWMAWFHRMELLARLGIVHNIPQLLRQIDALAGCMDADGLFARQLSHPYFRNWGAYTGLMLERDWRNPCRRAYDLTFRSLLIQHYAKAPL